MQNPRAKNSMQAHNLFSCRPDASPALIRVGNRSGCPTVHRFLNEIFTKDSEIYQAADLPAWLAQSATLDFPGSSSANAGENRSGTRPRNSAALCEFNGWIRQIRKHRAVVAIESGTRAGFETPSFRAETRARSRLRWRIFLVHRQEPRPFRSRLRHRTRHSFYRTARAFRSSACGLENQRLCTVA